MSNFLDRLEWHWNFFVVSPPVYLIWVTCVVGVYLIPWSDEAMARDMRRQLRKGL